MGSYSPAMMYPAAADRDGSDYGTVSSDPLGKHPATSRKLPSRRNFSGQQIVHLTLVSGSSVKAEWDRLENG
nr:hypothetical protein CFP56_75592 [Quercus suber]